MRKILIVVSFVFVSAIICKGEPQKKEGLCLVIKRSKYHQFRPKEIFCPKTVKKISEKNSKRWPPSPKLSLHFSALGRNRKELVALDLVSRYS